MVVAFDVKLFLLRLILSPLVFCGCCRLINTKSFLIVASVAADVIGYFYAAVIAVKLFFWLVSLIMLLVMVFL